ncbi:hypothetical protein LNJ06_12630 [Tenacibaculum finnmarkense genomovar ulcerans]|nr:hypothetical protein [Tenacibaculum finnmarkense genomovar ulcerans]
MKESTIRIENNCYFKNEQKISNFIIKEVSFKSRGHEIDVLIITIVNEQKHEVTFVFDKELTVLNFTIAAIKQGCFMFLDSINLDTLELLIENKSKHSKHLSL